jgi:hypothetical protein
MGPRGAGLLANRAGEVSAPTGRVARAIMFDRVHPTEASYRSGATHCWRLAF